MEMRISTAINNLSMYDIDECGNAELHTWYNGIGKDMEESFMVAVETMQKYQQLEDFARWVASEVIAEDMWQYNYSAFAEIACRKLVKLGIMQESNGKYLYEEVEDGDD